MQFLQGILKGLSIVAVLGSTLVACGGPGGETSNENPGNTPAVAKILMAVSQNSVKSDGSDSSTITATVLDKNNAIIPNAVVTFSSSSGVVVAAAAVTDTNGKITAAYNAGADKSNRTDTITATAANSVAGQIFVKVTGTQITLTAGSSSLNAPSGTTSLVATLTDAGGAVITDTPIVLSTSGAGGVTLSSSTVASGAAVTVTGASTGSATVTASALGVQSTINFSVSGGGNAFGITSPSASPATLVTGQALTIVISAPGLSSVQAATTLGTLTDANNAAATGSLINATVVSGVATVTLSSTAGGTATVQVTNPSNVSVSASLTVAISPPVANANVISVQANPSTIGVSFGGNQNSLSLRASVTDAAGQPIANVPVQFEIVNPVGGGEFISPAIAYTKATTTADGGVGDAVATFTSGSKASGQGASAIRIKATVVGNSTVSSTASVVISGVATSVTIGQSSKITNNASNTSYILPMSVQVADSAGNPVSGATVNLKVRPVAFSTGVNCTPAQTFIAEDASLNVAGTVIGGGNGNSSLDIGEDGQRYAISGNLGSSLGSSAGTQDGQLTPANSNAGTIPGQVTTAVDGTADFNFTYLKSNSIWTVVQMTASTLVGGTESQQSVIFRLAAAEEDVTTCRISNSPYLY